MNLDMGVHAHDGYAWAWRHVVAWVYGLEFIRDINSYAQLQKVKTAHVQASES